METIGLIGLGNIGSAIAPRLAADATVVGHDIDPAAHAALADLGGHPVDNVRDVGVQAGLVITALPSPTALHAVVAELLEVDIDGLVVAETSTLRLEDKEAARQTLARAGATLLDCPLSGTAMQARQGDVVVYASGDADGLAQAQPAFDSFARRTYHLGAFGQGMRMKLVANLLVAIHNVATAEALVLAGKAGLDPATVVDVVSDGAGTSRMFEVRGPMMVDGRYRQPGMNVGVFQKDVAIITDFARELGVPTPLLAASTAVYSAAQAHGWSGSDTASVYAILAELANVEHP